MKKYHGRIIFLKNIVNTNRLKRKYTMRKDFLNIFFNILNMFLANKYLFNKGLNQINDFYIKCKYSVSRHYLLKIKSDSFQMLSKIILIKCSINVIKINCIFLHI